jgi:hypothetical protein
VMSKLNADPSRADVNKLLTYSPKQLNMRTSRLRGRRKSKIL